MSKIEKTAFYMTVLLCLCFGGLYMNSGAAAAENHIGSAAMKYHKLSPLKVCVITAEISWNEGKDRPYRSQFMFDYMMTLLNSFGNRLSFLNVDFENFNRFTFFIDPIYCKMDRRLVFRNIFNSVAKDKNAHFDHMAEVKASLQSLNRYDLRNETNGLVWWDYVGKMTRADIEKCLVGLNFYTYSPSTAKNVERYSDSLGFFTAIFGFDIIGTDDFMIRSKPENMPWASDLDKDSELYFLVGRDCQKKNEKVNYLIDWVDKAIAGKLKKPPFRFVEKPDVDKFMHNFSH